MTPPKKTTRKKRRTKTTRAAPRRPLSKLKIRAEETPLTGAAGPSKLWAPWRHTYIKSSDWERPQGCVLCNLLKEEDGPGNLVLRRSERAYLVMNRFPYTNGHLMVVPRRHTADFAALSADEGRALQTLLQDGVRALEKAFRAQGFNIGMNLGRVAGAGIDEHLHFHIVPRWNGDTNFMPVLADVNVVNDHLQTAYESIRQALPARGR